MKDVKSKHPNLIVELWNETRIVKELQEDSSAGIKKYWFENSETSEDRKDYIYTRKERG